jgi:hypothetical protein
VRFVIGGVEPERDLGRGLGAVGGGEEIGGAQDQQSRGQVADLERVERTEKAPDLAVPKPLSTVQ